LLTAVCYVTASFCGATETLSTHDGSVFALQAAVFWSDHAIDMAVLLFLWLAHWSGSLTDNFWDVDIGMDSYRHSFRMFLFGRFKCI